MALEEVLREIARLSPSGGLVEITGGEPMLQEREVIPLMEQLLDADYQVLLETSGERPLAHVPKQVMKIVDVKCPHSGEANTFAAGNLKALQPHDELKFVLTDHADFEFARDFILNNRLAERVNAILFSPAFEKNASGARDISHCHARSQRTRRMDPRRQRSRAPQPANPQTDLGSRRQACLAAPCESIKSCAVKSPALRGAICGFRPAATWSASGSAG